jgi:GYF domain 2
MTELNPSSQAAQNAPISDTWHVEQNGTRKGPFSATQIADLISSSQLTRDSLCWRPGTAGWTPLSSTSFASKFDHEPPPLTGAAVSNGLVWTLAFAPLIGEFIAGMLAGASRTTIGKFWWVTLALNIGLSLLDERKLKAAGHDTKKMGGAWLVPVYLYKRSQVLKQNLAYFIVWVVCFLAMLAF